MSNVKGIPIAQLIGIAYEVYNSRSEMGEKEKKKKEEAKRENLLLCFIELAPWVLWGVWLY